MNFRNIKVREKNSEKHPKNDDLIYINFKNMKNQKRKKIKDTNIYGKAIRKQKKEK